MTVILQTNISGDDPGRLQVVGTDCQFLYEIPPPEPRRAGGNPVVDVANNRLISSWGDPDRPTTMQTRVYAFDSGALLCALGHGAFRQLLAGTMLWHGVGTVRIDSTVPVPDSPLCDVGPNYAIGTVNGVSTGDIRDLAVHREAMYVLLNPYTGPLPNSAHPGRLIRVNTTTRAVDWMTTDFGAEADPITNVNKMGIANDWAIVTHGRNGSAKAATWMATIVDLRDGMTVARFGRGRIHRLGHERLIDGGIFLHTSQYGNVIQPNKPLLAWKIGPGRFLGHHHLYGDERGNKYGRGPALTSVQGVTASCDTPTAAGLFGCTLINRYAEPIVDLVLTSAAFAETDYEVYTLQGARVGSGRNEIAVHMPLQPEAAQTLALVPAGTCHVLTAAYGNRAAPPIQTLWRTHRRLVPRWDAPWHQAFLHWYNQHGPRVAQVVRNHPWLQAVIRAVITPLARLTDAALPPPDVLQ